MTFNGIGDFETWVVEEGSTFLSVNLYDGDGVNFYINWEDGTSQMDVDLWNELIKNYDWPNEH